MLVFPSSRRHKNCVFCQFLDDLPPPNPAYITSLRISWVITLSRCGARGEDLSIVGAGKRMTDRVGQRLGNYRLIRLLGRGGFAEVYLGQHVRLNMQAAIKVLHTQLADENVANFHREAQTIAALVHPHIVRVLDFDVQDGVPFLVMDYVPNAALRRSHPRAYKYRFFGKGG